jgi:DnaJ-domain-containing protein 1
LLGTLRFGPRLLALLGPLTLWLLWALWRQQERTPRPDPSDTSAGGVMSRQEALRVLGLSEGASPEQVLAAHRQLIKKLHPDQGGSSFLAQQVNDAKQVLLER